MFHGIDDSHSAAQIWAILLGRYEKRDIVSQTAIIERLRMKKYEDRTSLTEHIVELDHASRTIKLSQHAYAERVLQQFNMSECNPTKMPLQHGTNLSKADMLVNDAECEGMKNVPYREALGSIMYLAVATQPDLAYAVQMLSRGASNPGRITIVRGPVHGPSACPPTTFGAATSVSWPANAMPG